MDMFIAHKLTIYCFRLWEWNLKLCGKYVRLERFFFQSWFLVLLVFPYFDSPFFLQIRPQVNFDIDMNGLFVFI